MCEVMCHDERERLNACLEGGGGIGEGREQCAYHLRKSLKRAEEI